MSRRPPGRFLGWLLSLNDPPWNELSTEDRKEIRRLLMDRDTGTRGRSNADATPPNTPRLQARIFDLEQELGAAQRERDEARAAHKKSQEVVGLYRALCSMPPRLKLAEQAEQIRLMTEAFRVAQDSLASAYRERDDARVESCHARDAAEKTAHERDAARLELRALEWLALHGYPVGRDPDGGRVMAVYREADLEPDWHPSWAAAARALGWEG